MFLIGAIGTAVVVTFFKTAIMVLVSSIAHKTNEWANKKIGDGVLESCFSYSVGFLLFFGFNCILYFKYSLAFRFAVSGAAALAAIILYMMIVDGDHQENYEFDQTGTLIINRPPLAFSLKRFLPHTETKFVESGIVVSHPSVLIRAAGGAVEIFAFTAPITLTLCLSLFIHGSSLMSSVKVIFAFWTFILIGLLYLCTFLSIVLGVVFGIPMLLYTTGITLLRIVAWIWGAGFFFALFALDSLSSNKEYLASGWPKVGVDWLALSFCWFGEIIWGSHELGVFIEHLFV